MSAFDELKHKIEEVDSYTPTPTELCIIWVADDGTAGGIEVAQKAADELAALRARVEELEACLLSIISQLK